jgi:hypothetical protein
LVGELYDYMLGIVIVGMIFISAVVAIPAISYVNMKQIDQQQLRNTALNLFNAILLGTGSPVNWGIGEIPFDENKVQAFGLALSEQSPLYTLDLEKLQRLDNKSLGYITYERARQLLGIKEDYGFRLQIFAPFRVNWDIGISGKQVWYSIDVTRNLDQRPIQNAEVSVITFCASGNNDKVNVTVAGPITGYTTALGKYKDSITFDIPPGYAVGSAMALFKITVGGISTMVAANTESLQDVLKINTFEDTITLTFRNELSGKGHSGNRKVLGIHSFNLDEEFRQIWDGSSVSNQEYMITYGEGYDYWSNTFDGLSNINPGMLIFTISAPLSINGSSSARKPIIFTGPFSGWDSSQILSFGSLGQPTDARVQLRRYVSDNSGMMYIAELLFWEE